MFQKNLEAIRIHNPQLAERLEKIDINSIQGIEVFQAESNDLIISYKDVPLHSPIDPIREAKTLWNRTVKNELGKNDIQIVFGLGLGYLFKRAYVNAESKIFILEPFIEVIRFVAEHVDFAKEFADKRVYITDNVGDIYNKLQKEYLSGDKVEFLFINQVAQANKDLLQDLTSKTFEIIGSKGNDENTIFKLCKFWTDNFIKNLTSFSEARPLGYFDGKFANKTALIISPGPSLAEDIEKIKKNQDKFVTIAVGRAFKILVNAGIIPDFTVFADAKYCVEQIKGAEDFLEKTNVILTSKSDNDIYKLKSKSKILYLSVTDKMAKLFEIPNLKDTGFYNSGSSVSIISYYLAKALGFNKIAFSGLDLSYSGTTIYADGQQMTVNGQANINIMHTKTVVTYDKEGNMLQTRDDYAWFIRQFAEIFSEEINLAKIINTSLKGAYIEGMEYMPFSEFVSTLSESKQDVDEIISEVFKETKDEWNQTLSRVSSEIIKINEELQIINKESAEISDVFNKICTEYNENGKIVVDDNFFNSLNTRVIEIRQKLVNNVIISSSMQKEIWNYTRHYITKPLPSKEEVFANLELDRDFFKQAAEISSNLIDVLSTTLTYFDSKKKVTAS